jgi:hypothetical protein
MEPDLLPHWLWLHLEHHLFDIGQLFTAHYGFRNFGPEWFRLTSGHWGWWLAALFTSASNFSAELDKSRHFAWVAWKVCLWRWQGSPGSFLTSISTDGLIVEVTAAWDEFGNKIV